jgi:hypothetical protein
VSDKFFNPVEVPVIPAPPESEVGFVRIYGRGNDAYAVFPNGEEKLLTGTNPVNPGTDRDVSFPDVASIGDTFSTQFKFADTSAASDAANYGPFVLDDSAAASDSVNGATLAARSDDSLAASDAANTVLDFRAADTAAASDDQTFAARVLDAGGASDARQAAVADAVNWADAVNTSDSFANTENMIDLDEATASTITAQQTALSGAVTNTGNITVSLPDPTITPAPTVNTTQLRWGWTTTQAGTLQSGESLSVVIAYSLDNGGLFTTLETVTNVDGTGDSVANITATYAELLQIRFRAVATVTSGTAATLNARQVFGFRYAQCAFNITQTL